VPALHTSLADKEDEQMISDIAAAKEKVERNLENYKFRDALFEVLELARKGNKYMQDKQPWILAKNMAEDGERKQALIDNCLHICLQLTANLAVLINPFLPFTARKMCYMMKVVEKMLDWKNAGTMKLLSVGYSLRPPELLFRKIEDEEIAKQVEKLRSGLVKNVDPGTIQKNMTEENIPAAEAAPVKPEIQYDDFAKLDFKIGTIINAEKVEKADKLLKLEVDLGFEKRTIVSGIALHFKPEDIIGKQVTVVANLAPRKMRGIESNGMILMAEDKKGKLHFIHGENKIDDGSGVS
ncbi:MAG: methionine--tRNA ligase subunit beta, partial [Chitinophagaceae bacterium]